MFLRDAVSGQYWKSSVWLLLKVLTIPLYAVGTLWLYQFGRTWSISEFPYWIMSIVISLILYSSILKTCFSWKEAVGIVLILTAVCMIDLKREEPEAAPYAKATTARSSTALGRRSSGMSSSESFKAVPILSGSRGMVLRAAHPVVDELAEPADLRAGVVE